MGWFRGLGRNGNMPDNAISIILHNIHYANHAVICSPRSEG